MQLAVRFQLEHVHNEVAGDEGNDDALVVGMVLQRVISLNIFVINC